MEECGHLVPEGLRQLDREGTRETRAGFSYIDDKSRHYSIACKASILSWSETNVRLLWLMNLSPSPPLSDSFGDRGRSWSVGLLIKRGPSRTGVWSEQEIWGMEGKARGTDSYPASSECMATKSLPYPASSGYMATSFSPYSE